MHPQLSQIKNDPQLSVIAMSKNPYEIRLDVMKMAQDMLEKEKEAEQTQFYEKLNIMRESQVPTKDIQNFIDENSPKSYDENEVIARASTLYNFVSSSKS